PSRNTASRLRAGVESSVLRALLRLRFLEHAIDALSVRVAAGLRLLGRSQSLIGRALRALRRLLSRGDSALRRSRRIARGFGNRTDLIELLLLDSSAAGHDRKTADECRCSQSSLDFSGH